MTELAASTRTVWMQKSDWAVLKSKSEVRNEEL